MNGRDEAGVVRSSCTPPDSAADSGAPPPGEPRRHPAVAAAMRIAGERLPTPVAAQAAEDGLGARAAGVQRRARRFPADRAGASGGAPRDPLAFRYSSRTSSHSVTIVPDAGGHPFQRRCDW
ncbi:hypothetical protein GCM10009834_49730 [Streptomonospora arabica]